MKRVSSGGRHIGGAGYRGMSRGGRSSSGSRYRSLGITTRYRNAYKVRRTRKYGYQGYTRMYGSSILPFWARILFFLILIGLLYVGIKY